MYGLWVCRVARCCAELPFHLFCFLKMNFKAVKRMCLQVMESGFVLNIPFLFEVRIVCSGAGRLVDLLSGNMQQDELYGPFGVLLALKWALSAVSLSSVTHFSVRPTGGPVGDYFDSTICGASKLQNITWWLVSWLVLKESSPFPQVDLPLGDSLGGEVKKGEWF